MLHKSDRTFISRLISIKADELYRAGHRGQRLEAKDGDETGI